MCLARRILLVSALLSLIVAITAAADWVAMSRRDTFVPVGNRWGVAGRPDRWEFNMDEGGWSLFRPPGGDGGFFPDGFNATFALERRFSPTAGYPPEWAERTLASAKVRNVISASLVFPTLWLIAAISARRHRVTRGFPVGT